MTGSGVSDDAMLIVTVVGATSPLSIARRSTLRGISYTVSLTRLLCTPHSHSAVWMRTPTACSSSLRTFEITRDTSGRGFAENSPALDICSSRASIFAPSYR